MLDRFFGFFLGFRPFHRRRIRGANDLPDQGECVAIANRCTFPDPPIPGSAIPPQSKFMAKACIPCLPGGDGLPERRAIAAVNGSVRRALEECRAKAGELAARAREGMSPWRF